jgi:putative NADH-flavin reductase
MKVVLFGATGMVGAGVLLECFADPRVTSVLAITRSPTGRSHPKLREVLQQDFFDFESLRADFAECDACFFCLGITSIGLERGGLHARDVRHRHGRRARDGGDEPAHDVLLCLGRRDRQH